MSLPVPRQLPLSLQLPLLPQSHELLRLLHQEGFRPNGIPMPPYTVCLLVFPTLVYLSPVLLVLPTLSTACPFSRLYPPFALATLLQSCSSLSALRSALNTLFLTSRGP